LQTNFSAEALADPHTRELEGILRSCVHCGLCTATCPTYVTQGDERDSPRGRIYLMKDLLETGRNITAEDVWPIDHCLSCLSCMTTCPSGVDYRRLVDQARVQIHETYRRPIADRLMRAVLVRLIASRWGFRAALRLAAAGRFLGPAMRRLTGIGPKLEAMLALAPKAVPAPGPAERPGVHMAQAGGPRRRMALLGGCAEAVLAPQVSAATIRLLNRAGVEVVVPNGEGCCGSLAHHMGVEERALAQARADIDAWTREIEGEGLEAIVVTASGCGATIKDYGYMLRDDPAYAKKAARVAALARDVSEVAGALDVDFFTTPRRLVVAYHAACSLQHGQKIVDPPKALLRRAGFEVRSIPEGHLCCGSAGTYNILQPEIAKALRDRKVANIARVRPDAIAAGNIGCMTQIAAATATPVVHTVELLDWASGGPPPAGLA
jgi:glycolate oxidase iron-sulfur subunit